MKDFHDLILMIREPSLLVPKKLKASISATLANRGTALQIPIRFDAHGIAALQGLWGRHLTTLGSFRQKLKLPDQMNDVLIELNDWLAIHVGKEQ